MAERRASIQNMVTPWGDSPKVKERGGNRESQQVGAESPMKVILPLPRCFSVSAVLLVLVFSGCGKKAAPEGGAPADAPTPAPREASVETTATAQVTPAPQPLPETAPFFSERFLPPTQRLQRRQARILQVLETTTTPSGLP